MAKRMIRFNWRIFFNVMYLLSGITGLVILLGAVGTKSQEQACTAMKIIILGDEAFIEQRDIAALVEEGYGALVGRTLESIPIHVIEKDLRQIPYVQHAVASVDMNGVLLIQIQQRKAVLRILGMDGTGYYVDQEGLKMPVSLNYIPKVPVASGHIREPYGLPLDSMGSRLVKDLFEVSEFINRNEFWEHQIVQLYVNAEEEIELIPRTGQQRILLGDASELEDKFERLMVFYRGIAPKVGINAYQGINLKYAGQLICERGLGFDTSRLPDMIPAGPKPVLDSLDIIDSLSEIDSNDRQNEIQLNNNSTNTQ